MKKVLVVDDEPALADLIGEFCAGAGFEVKTVNDGQAALRLVETWVPDLITLDIEMPGMTGLEVIKTLQGNPLTSKIPVVVISVVAKGALEEGALAGVHKVFEKPLSFQRLVGQLRDLLAAQPTPPQPVHPPLESYFKIYA